MLVKIACRNRGELGDERSGRRGEGESNVMAALLIVLYLLVQLLNVVHEE